MEVGHRTVRGKHAPYRVVVASRVTIELAQIPHPIMGVMIALDQHMKRKCATLKNVQLMVDLPNGASLTSAQLLARVESK